MQLPVQRTRLARKTSSILRHLFEESENHCKSSTILLKIQSVILNIQNVMRSIVHFHQITNFSVVQKKIVKILPESEV